MAWALSGSVWAQSPTPPGAGALLNQMEQARPTLAPKTIPPVTGESRSPASRPKDSTGVEVTLKDVQFEGNQLLSSQRLREAVAHSLGRPLKFSELQDIAVEVAQTYREAGWVVRAYLPQQDLSAGVLLVKVVEARFGGVRFSGQEHASVPLQVLSDRASSAQAVDQPIRLPSIERSGLLMEDLPGMGVTTSLVPGPQDNQSSLLVNITSKPRWGGDVGIDNMGSPATGTRRTVANLNFLSPASLGDQLGINFAHTAGSNYLRLGYTLPVGSDGWRLGVNASDMNYKLVAPEFLSIAGHGQSTTQGLEASYPLLRSRMRNLNLTASVDRKSFANYAAGELTSQYSTHTFTAGFSGYAVDTWSGTGVSIASVSLTTGKVNLDGSPTQAADESTGQTQGSFNKLKYVLSRQQALTDKTTLSLTLMGQQASKNLDSSEKFFLGGGAGVRAFPSGEGGGSEGNMLNVEWRWMPRSDVSFATFVDWGRVRVNKYNDYPGAPTLNQFDLKGGGLSLTLTGSGGWMGKAVWARRIAANPNATDAGLDQDGTFIRNRIWLQATMTL